VTTRPLSLIGSRDLHGDGDHGNPTGMKANVAGFPREWKFMSWDSRRDGKNLYRIPTEV